MSRTKAHHPKAVVVRGTKRKRPNNLGLCNCVQCKWGRRGQKDGGVMKVKRSIRRWWSNKPPKYGAYTD